MAGFLLIAPIGAHALSPAIQSAVNFRTSKKFAMPNLYIANFSSVKEVGSWLTGIDKQTGELFNSHFETSFRECLAEKVRGNIMRPIHQKYIDCEFDISRLADWREASAKSCRESEMISGFSGTLEELLNFETIKTIGNIGIIIGDTAKSSIKHAVYPLYERMISAAGVEQDKIAKKLALLVNVLGVEKQDVLKAQKINPGKVVNEEDFEPKMYHGLFEGLVLNNMLFEGGDKGRYIWFSPTSSSSIFYATSYRDRDLKADNMTTGDLQGAINPIPLGTGITLEFSTQKLLDYAVFSAPPFEEGCISSEEACSRNSHVPFNALTLESKKEIIRMLKLPISFIRLVVWMDPEWQQAYSMI